jgi:4-amino-4-deoxy-L-arabinose transferase-like glycosyltransferase
MRVLVCAAAVYLIAPGHPDLMFGGLPLGQSGTVFLIALIGAWAWTRDVSGRTHSWPVATVGAAIALKLAFAWLAPHSGWLAHYYANDNFAPPAQRSLDFLDLPGTRIDRQLSFVDTEFPVHFFNDRAFSFGLRREATEAFSVHWRGYLHAEDRMVLEPASRGALEVIVDGQAAPPTVVIEPGEHLVEVKYQKPRGVEGLVRVLPRATNGALRQWRIGEVTPEPQPVSRRRLAGTLSAPALALHVIVLIAILAALGPALSVKASTAWRELRSNPVHGLHHWVAPVVLVGLLVQGLWKSRHLVDHVWTLTGGDDWLQFEVNARDVLLNGWLNDYGLTDGLPFFVYPGYGYFLAAVHAVTGETLAGAILANFAALAGATILAYLLARELVTPLAAYLAVAWLLMLEQLDFVRYYTVTLLSENLFLLLVAATLFALVRFMTGGRWSALVVSGICGGLATATRPTMLLFLPAAVVLLATDGMLRRKSRRGLIAATIVATTWMAAVGPFTLRNYLVTGRPVLVTEGQGQTFVRYNLPPGGKESNVKYYQGFDGSNISAIKTVLRILWDHPAYTLRQWGVKAGFSFGMVHWVDSKPHPELVLTSAMYFGALVMLASARTIPALAVHLFIATHLATLLLTTPWNYGYRMLLAMFMLMPIFAGALLAKPLEGWLRRSRPSWLAAT